MGASGDVGGKEPTKLSVGQANTGGAKVFLKVVPDLFDSVEVSNSNLDQEGKAQSDITEHFLGAFIPVLVEVTCAPGINHQQSAHKAAGTLTHISRLSNSPL